MTKSKEPVLVYTHGFKTCINRSKNRIENRWFFKGFEINQDHQTPLSILEVFKNRDQLSNSKNSPGLND